MSPCGCPHVCLFFCDFSRENFNYNAPAAHVAQADSRPSITGMITWLSGVQLSLSATYNQCIVDVHSTEQHFNDSVNLLRKLNYCCLKSSMFLQSSARLRLNKVNQEIERNNGNLANSI